MYLFDEYTNKVNKAKKIVDKIKKFKVLIISVVSLIVVLIIGFLSTKGIILSSLNFNTHYNYGEEYDFGEAKSLFSNAYYEYSMAGTDEWTNVKPTSIGKYSVRVVSKRAFGITSYSDPVDFIIGKKPTNISILDDSIEYGKKPNYSIELLSTDSVLNIDFVFDDISKNKTTIRADEASLKIVSKNGDDVTSYYDFKTNEKEIEITPVSITLTPKMNSKVYTGKPIEYDSQASIISGEIVKNDIITFDIKEKELPTRVGNYELNIDSETLKATTSTGVDVSGHYSFNVVKKEYKILPKIITVITPSKSFIYDGQEHSLSDGYQNTELAIGDTINVTSKSVIKNVGQVDNELEASFVNESLDDVTDCYDIIYECGNLTVTPMELLVTLKPLGNREYDGSYTEYLDTDNNYDNIVVSNSDKNLPEDVSFKLSVGFTYDDIKVGKVKNAGQYSLYLESFETINDLNINYNISIIDASFEILKRNIDIELKNLEATYNGKNFVYDDIYTDDVALDKFKIIVEYETNEKVYTEVINSGEYSIKFKAFESVEGSLPSNYNVNAVPGTLKILKRDVTIAPHQNFLNNATYCGTLINYNEQLSNYDVVNGSFVDGEAVTVKACANEGGVNAGDYEYSITEILYNDGINKNNYNINTITNTLSIYKRDVTIRPSKDFVDGNVYNGKIHLYDNNSNNNYEVVEGQFVEGEYIGIEVSSDKELMNSDSYTLSVTGFDFVSGNKDNYNIIFTTQDFQILPKPVTLRPSSSFVKFDNDYYDYKEKTYSNEYGNYIDVNGSIVENEDFIITVNFESIYGIDTCGINAGDYVLNIVDVYSENAKTSNYAFTYEKENFTINKRKVVLSAVVEDIVYDGKNHSNDYNGLQYEDGSLEIIDVDLIEFTFSSSITNDSFSECYNVDNYVNTLKYSCFSEKVENNYDITIVPKSFEIVKREAVISPSIYYFEDNLEYDGKEHYYSDDFGNFKDVSKNTNTGFVNFDNYNYKISVSYLIGDNLEKLLHAGEYNVKIANIMIKEEPGIVDNYDISFSDEEVKVIVNKRKTVIKPIDNEVEYSATVFEYADEFNNYENPSVYGADSYEKIVSGESFKITVNFIQNELLTDAKNAGEYEIIVNDIIPGENSYKEDYYFIYATGLLTISRKKVVLDLLDIEDKVYDGKVVTYLDEANNFIIKSGGFVGDESFRLIGVFSDSLGNTIDNPHDAGEYRFEYIEFIPVNGELVDNYDISIVRPFYYFNIERRTVNIEIKSMEDNNKVYDGKEESYKKYNGTSFAVTSDTSIVEGEEFGVNVSFISNLNSVYSDVILHAAVYSSQSQMYSLSDNANVDNYNFLITEITYTINAAPLTVALVDVRYTIEFNNQIYRYANVVSNFNIITGELYNLDVLSLDVSFRNDDTNEETDEIIEVGNYTLFIKSYTSSSGYLDYDISLDAVYKTTITKRRIIVKAFEFDDKIYDGLAYSYPSEYNNYTLVSSFDYNDIIPDMMIYVSFVNEEIEYQQAINFGEYKVICTGYEFKNEIDNERFTVEFDNDNYFNIFKRKTVVKPLDNECIYNGEIVKSEDWTLTEESNPLLINDILIVKISALDLNGNIVEPINAGTYDLFISECYFVDNQENYELIYSERARLVISRRDITIKPIDRTITYDGLYHYYEDNTLYEYVDDSLRFVNNEGISSIEVNYDGFSYVKNARIYKAVIDSISFNEYTLASNYNIIRKDGSFEIAKASVTFSPLENNFDKELVYDGEQFVYKVYPGNYKASKVINDEYFEITPTFIIIDAGEYDLVFDILNVEECEDALLENYDLSFEITTITIAKRKVSISLFTPVDFVYSGEIYSYEDSFDNYILLDGSYSIVERDGRLKVHATVDYKNELILDAGIHTLRLKDVSFESSVGNISNYEIYCTDQQFEVFKKKATIELLQIENFTYVGENLSVKYPDEVGNYASCEGIISSEEVKVAVKFNGNSNVGSHSYDLDVDNTKIYRNGIEMSCSNYSLSWTTKSFKITPLDIHITNMKNEEVYTSVPIENYNSKFELTPKLCDKDSLVLKCFFEDGVFPVDVGRYNFKSYEITFEIGDSNNYNLIIDEVGYLDIVKKDLNLSVDDSSMTFGDRIPSMNISSSGLCENDKLIGLEIIFKRGEEILIPNDSGKYTITIDSDSIKYLDKNYNVNIETSTLTIKPKEVLIKINAFEDKLYDGAAISYEDDNYGNYLYSSIDKMFKIHIKFSYSNIDYDSIVNAGYYRYFIDDFEISEGLKTNYSLKLENEEACYVTIKKRDIKVNTGGEGAQFTYDGKCHYIADEYKLVEGSLLTNQRLEFVYNKNGVYTKYVNVGNYLNRINVLVYDDLNNDLSINYNINYEYGSFSILPKEVNIYISDYSKIYDAKTVTISDLNPSVDGVLDKDTYDLVTYDGLKEIATEFNDAVDTTYYLTISFTRGENNKNYVVNCDKKKMVIEKKLLEVNIPNQTNVYNTRKITYDLSKITVGGLLCDEKIKFDYNVIARENHSYEIDLKKKQLLATNVDIYEISITDLIITLKDKVVNNYKIEGNEMGLFTIDKLVVEISTETKGFIYNGNPQSWGSYYYPDNENSAKARNLIIKLASLATVTTVQEGRVKNDMVATPYNRNGIDISDNVDIIIREYGEIYIINEIKVNIPKIIKEYNGSILFYESNICESNEVYEHDNHLDVKAKINYHIVQNGLTITPKTTGLYDAVIDGVRIYNADNIDITDVFDFISWNDGDSVFENDKKMTVSISRRVIYLKPNKKEKTYDGEALSINDDDFSYISYSSKLKIYESSEILPIDNYSIKIYSTSYNIEPGSVNSRIDYAYFVENGIVVEPLATVDASYTLYENYVLVYGYVEDFYSISYQFDMDNNNTLNKQFNNIIQIKKRTIKITPGGKVKEYDGRELSVNDWQYGDNTNKDGLLQGDEFVVKENSYRVKEAGDYVNMLMFTLYRDGRVIDNAKDYYEISYDSDNLYKLIITKRKITITTDSISEAYDNLRNYDEEPIECKNYTVQRLIENHNIASIIFSSKITKADIDKAKNMPIKEKNEALVLKIVDEYGNNTFRNYNIEYIYGTLEIYR